MMKSFWQGAIVIGVASTVIVANAPQSLAASFSYSNNTAGSILDNQTVSRDIVIGSGERITDLTVTISNLSHTWIGDLVASLTHVETGTTIDLFNRVGRLNNSGFGNSADFQGSYSFNDAFTQNLWSTTAVNGKIPGGNYFTTTSNGTRSSLSAFNGQNLAGTWRLSIADRASGDTGSFSSWSMSGTAVPVPPQIVGTVVLAGLGAAKKFRKKDRKLLVASKA